MAEKSKITGRRILRIGVNIFVYTIVGVMVILMLFFGISQTSFFKNWLKDEIVDIVNNEINGNLSIGDLDGTIFTSILLRNTTLTTLTKDTVVHAGYIEVKTSPLKIIFKNIYARKIELKDVSVKLIEEEDGNLNLLKIFPSSEEPEDTTKSEFPFTILVAALNLENVDFSLQKFDKVGSSEKYSSMNFEDFRIDDLNLSLSAFADLNKYDFRLNIDKISFQPNFQFFNLKHLEGNFLLSRNAAGIDNLKIETDNSNINLSAGITGVDFLENFSTYALSNGQLRADMEFYNLSFDELITFIPALDLLSGETNGEIVASGTLNNLSVKKINLYYNQTKLLASGRLRNILDSDSLYIDVTFKDSFLDPSDPNKILKNIELPEYPELGIIKFNELRYFGNPLNFTTSFNMETEKGKLDGTATLNFIEEDMKYDVEVNTAGLDISPFAGFPTNLNSKIIIKGSGTDPENLNTEVNLQADKSVVGLTNTGTFRLNATAKDKLIDFDYTMITDTADINLNGSIDYLVPQDPFYSIEGSVNNLNLARLMNNPSLDSRIEMDIQAEGRGFDPDSMDLFLVMDSRNSNIFGYQIDSTRLILDLRRNDNGVKVVNLVSDLADLTVKGNFTFSSLIDVASKQSSLIANEINSRIDSVLSNQDSELTIQTEITDLNKLASVNFNAAILLDFKEFVPIKFNDMIVEIGGEINGEILYNPNEFYLNISSNLDYFKFLTGSDLYFLTKSEIELEVINLINQDLNNNLEIDLTFNTDRAYLGTNLYDVSSMIRFKDDQIDIDFTGSLSDYLTSRIKANVMVENRTAILNLTDFKTTYKNLPIVNQNNIKISYKENTFSFDQFNLSLAEGLFTVNGSFGKDGEHLTNINLKNVNGAIIAKKILGLADNLDFSSEANLQGVLSGNFTDPKFSISLDVKDIKLDKQKIGSIKTNFDYADNLLNADLVIIDSQVDIDIPKFSVAGYIPLNLTFSDDSTKIQKEESINLKIESDKFDLASVGYLIPNINLNSGILETDIAISGKFDKPNITGYLNIKDARIKLLYNNLDYDFNTNVYWDNQIINIESFSLGNTIGTKYGGTLKGSGIVKLDGFTPDSIYIALNGELKVLDKISRSVSPAVYGDLSIMTKGDIVFQKTKDEMDLTLPINVTVADLTFPLSKSAYSNTSGFIYKYADYGLPKGRVESELDSLIQLTEQMKISTNANNGKMPFNYSIDIDMKTEAKMIVILSKELNQNLVAVLSGNFNMSSIDGVKRTSGEFKLLEGSQLSFVKTFEAEGNVKFEKLDNPLLDITATYEDYYYPVTESGNVNEQEVAVKIKLTGPLSDLNKNFIKDENNIGVYIGRENIEKNQRDPTKTPSDAIFFIVAGKFTDGATLQERNAVASTATNLAGSVLGSFLNQYLGDYVRSVQLRQVGTQTKFSLIGKAGDFRYEIGGSTEVFQDLSRANIKIEYPIQNKFFIRLERKESFIDQYSVGGDLYNEVGLKYLFEF